MSPVQHQACEAVMAILSCMPLGLSASDLALVASMSGDKTLRVLRLLRDAGKVKALSLNGGAVWCAAEFEAEARRASAERQQAVRQRRRDLAREAMHLRREQAARDADVADEAWLQPLRRIVPASEAPPIRTRAVNSIFNLAGA